MRGGLSAYWSIGLVFCALKLAGVIDWPILWVLSPYWIGGTIFLVACVAVIIKNAVKNA